VPHFSKLFDIHMMCWGTGQERTEAEYLSLLERAGWTPAGSYYPANCQMGIITGVCACAAEDEMKIDGRCHCGCITYEADIDPDKVLICHCTDCQTLSGSAFRVVAYTREDAFKLLSGEPRTYVKISESGNKRPQTFCPECGTPIYATAGGEGPKVYSIRVGSIRQRDQIVPNVQVWSRSAHPWVTHIGSMRRFEKQPQIDQTGKVTLT
jgi:hypothetical protein